MANVLKRRLEVNLSLGEWMKVLPSTPTMQAPAEPHRSLQLFDCTDSPLYYYSPNRGSLSVVNYWIEGRFAYDTIPMA
jgi:hypothetical protein